MSWLCVSGFRSKRKTTLEINLRNILDIINKREKQCHLVLQVVRCCWPTMVSASSRVSTQNRRNCATIFKKVKYSVLYSIAGRKVDMTTLSKAGRLKRGYYGRNEEKQSWETKCSSLARIFSNSLVSRNLLYVSFGPACTRSKDADMTYMYYIWTPLPANVISWIIVQNWQMMTVVHSWHDSSLNIM